LSPARQAAWAEWAARLSIARDGTIRLPFGAGRTSPIDARDVAANRYDRLTQDVEAITGRPATSARDFVARHAKSFAP
jgi:hypothetical protein